VICSKNESTLVRQYLSRFKNPLVLVLLVASAISVLTGEMTNFTIISSLVFLSVTLDFVQEHRAQAAAEKLRQTVALTSSVLRDGVIVKLKASELVPGDVVQVSVGDLIPADGLILEARHCFVSQVLLTGESYPAEKRANPLPPTATEVAEAANALFMGTSVISGSARFRVVKTGSNTTIGAIADSLSRPAPPTSFEIGTRRFGMLIMRLTVLLVLFVLLVNMAFHKPWLQSFLFAVALAVGLTPELLPMVVSVTLSRGALRMARKQMIVKRLSAIQDLGSMDILCTDKTGTLTEARIQLERYVDTLGQPCERVLDLAYLNSFFQAGLKSPLDEAIMAKHVGETASWKKVDEVPFDFERRRVAVLLDNGTERWLVVKGAPDEMMGLCTCFESHSSDSSTQIATFSDKTREGVQAQYKAMERNGLRALAIAWRKIDLNQSHISNQDEKELILVGFTAFLDPPKASAALALAELARLGVAIKVVTGDSDLVTRHVCEQLKLPVTGVLTGKEIAQLDDLALQAQVETNNLFCRVNPAQKERVIHALRARGHVVGYLGDGINDASSLHAADVGLSVDTAVDVAKEAADMILLKPDLHVLLSGVLEGRRTFGNIMKYIMMGTSSNFGNMFSMAGAALFLPFLPMLPTQILLNNMLYDISEMAIPLDKVDIKSMRRPHILDLRFINRFMWVIGPISSAFDFLTFYVMQHVFKASEALFQTGWFVESLCTQVLVIFIIRTPGNPLKSHAHPLLILSSLFIVGVAGILPYTALGAYFGFVPPPPLFYGILGVLVVAYLLVVALAKKGFYRWMER
jgi:Mg2+-importing ATPase